MLCLRTPSDWGREGDPFWCSLERRCVKPPADIICWGRWMLLAFLSKLCGAGSNSPFIMGIEIDFAPLHVLPLRSRLLDLSLSMMCIVLIPPTCTFLWKLVPEYCLNLSSNCRRWLLMLDTTMVLILSELSNKDLKAWRYCSIMVCCRL